MPGTVLSTASRALLDACVCLGLDAGALLARSGLDEATVRDPEARIPAARADAMWQAAFELSGRPDLALRAAGLIGPADYRVHGYLFVHSRTVGEGLRRIVRWFDLVDRRVRFEVSAEPGELARVAMSVPGLPGGVPRPPAEYTLGAFVVSLRRVLGPGWAPTAVQFEFAAPAEGDHAAFFGAPCRFSAERTALLFTPAAWAAPLPSPDAILLGLLEEHAALQRAALPVEDGPAAELRQALAEGLSEGRVSVREAAERIGTSPRTLQRRLAEEGTTFAQVLDALRLEWARVYLADRSLALSEVALLLGFSEAAAFSRAFRRWTGDSPRAFRDRRGG